MASGVSPTSLHDCKAADVDKYVTLEIEERIAIRKFVVGSKGLEWRRGAAFYQFTKTELVQAYKEIIARDDVTGVLYEGEALRALLGFRTSDGATVQALRLKPKSFKEITLFVQSTSVNRILLPGTSLLYRASPEDRAVLGFKPADALVSAKVLHGSQSRMSQWLAQERSDSPSSLGSGSGSGAHPAGPPALGEVKSPGSELDGGEAGAGLMAQPPINVQYASAASLMGASSRGDASVWSVEQVVEWLEACGLGACAQVFAEADIDGEVLVELTRDELIDNLGLSLGRAKKVVKAIAALSSSSSSASSSSLPPGSFGLGDGLGGGLGGGLGPAAGDSDEATPEWEIPIKSLMLLDMVGSGAFGKVYRAKWRGAPVAVKLLSMRTLDEEQLAEFRREAAIMTRLRHPNVVALLGVSSVAPNLAIIAEFCAAGSLDKFLYNPEIVLSEWDRLKLVTGMAAGMEYLSGAGIIHRDLAARNILVTESGEAKISDFGMSREDLLPKNTTAATTGPLKWMAPEALQGSYSEATDVWAFGVTVWELVHEALPYDDMTAIEVAAQVLQGCLSLPLAAHVNPVWANIITTCTRYDPAARPTFAQIHTHISSFAGGDDADPASPPSSA